MSRIAAHDQPLRVIAVSPRNVRDMDTDRLLEPLGLLHGEAAIAACREGLALPLAGGPAAFSLCRLIDGSERHLLPTAAIPDTWQPILARVTARPASAGLPAGVIVMGILNLTPDSFSDGGRLADDEAAVSRGLEMVEQGAAIVDIGGESTRPGATLVPPRCEQARILPIVSALAAAGTRLSVDTRHADTMRAALRAGASMINDVSALSNDAASRSVVADAGCPVVLMHMRGTPATMSTLTGYDDVAVDVVRALGCRIAEAEAAGIHRSRIIVDPGIGFAKTEMQNLELLRRLPILANLGCRVLLGVSRKGFVGRIGEAAEPTARLPGSLAAALPALALADTILRVHDVAETMQAVRLWQGVHG